jgi:NADH-quinone oxidoreductase subunit A
LIEPFLGSLPVLEDYSAIAIFLLLCTGVSVLILFLSRLMGPFRPSTRKLEPYESGMTPIGPAMRRLPVKFYLVAVLFILFDIEIVFFLPFAVVARQLGLFALAEMGTFVVILLIGYVYAWRKGALEWE